VHALVARLAEYVLILALIAMIAITAILFLVAHRSDS